MTRGDFFFFKTSSRFREFSKPNFNVKATYVWKNWSWVFRDLGDFLRERGTLEIARLLEISWKNVQFAVHVCLYVLLKISCNKCNKTLFNESADVQIPTVTLGCYKSKLIDKQKWWIVMTFCLVNKHKIFRWIWRSRLGDFLNGNFVINRNNNTSCLVVEFLEFWNEGVSNIQK